MKLTLTALAFAASFAFTASAGSLEQQVEKESAFPGRSIAIGWAAESCNGNELSRGDRAACNALGLAGKAEDSIRDDEWLPVYLKCPDSKNNGALISIDENLKGGALKNILTYRSDTVESVEFALANTNSNYGKAVKITINEVEDMKILKFARNLVGDLTPLNNKICNADSPTAKVRFDQIARANRINLRKAAPNNFHEDVPGRNIDSLP